MRAAFLRDGTQILPKIFKRRATPEPVAHVDFVNHEAGFEHDHVRNHGIVGRIGIFGDVEFFLDNAAGIREERPMSADAGAVLAGFGDVARNGWTSARHEGIKGECAPRGRTVIAGC